jgi:hypothetical protein
MGQCLSDISFSFTKAPVTFGWPQFPFCLQVTSLLFPRPWHRYKPIHQEVGIVGGHLRTPPPTQCFHFFSVYSNLSVVPYNHSSMFFLLVWDWSRSVCGWKQWLFCFLYLFHWRNREQILWFASCSLVRSWRYCSPLRERCEAHRNGHWLAGRTPLGAARNAGNSITMLVICFFALKRA